MMVHGVLCNTLILEELKPRENPKAIELTHIEIWIQVHNLHSGFMSTTIARTVGEYMESFVSSNEKNFTGFWKEHMRVRVSIDVHQLLRGRCSCLRGV